MIPSHPHTHTTAHAQRRLRTVAAFIGLASLVHAGCSTLIGNGFDLPNRDDQAGDATDTGNPTPAERVEVRLANLTDHAVDVELFVSADPQDDNANTLFVEANRRTNGVGLAGTGVLPPDEVDVLTLECDAAAVLGTAGGTFLDVDSGEALGTGVARILTSGLVFDCGAEITLVYREIETGVFTVQVGLQ